MPNDLSVPEQVRKRIQEFQESLLAQEQIEIPITQYFTKGVYMRRMDLAEGTILTGKIHKYPCLNIIVKGQLEVVTENGPIAIVGPWIYESPAGTKRAIHALTDAIWITVHANPENLELEPEGMAQVYTVDTYKQLEAFQAQQLEHKS